jgi:hypothetical protein
MGKGKEKERYRDCSLRDRKGPKGVRADIKNKKINRKKEQPFAIGIEASIGNHNLNGCPF